MDTTGTARALRVVRDTDREVVADEGERPPASTEDYWARVQSLRADRARLRPAN